jgi:hypothetical protein
VYNHSHPDRSFDYAGGMTVLLMLAGFSFARFALNGGSPQSVRRAVAKLAFKIWLPCFAIVVLSFIVRGQFSLSELLFVSNWHTNKHLAFMFVWYPQVLLQILALTFILFSLPTVSEAFLRRPFAWSLALFAPLMAATVLLAPSAAAAEISHPTLPHLIAWNFVLGWVVFFALREAIGAHAAKVKALLVLGTIACAGATYSVFALNFWTLSGSVAVLSFAPILTLPSFLARILYVVGQASFAIFLLHVIYLRVYEKILKLQDPDLAWLFAMVFSTLTWIVGTAALRAYRRVADSRAATDTTRVPVRTVPYTTTG